MNNSPLSKVQYNYYKNETFCLGMIILSLICSNDIQKCYNRKSNSFDQRYFEKLKSEMSSKKSDNPLEKNFFRYVIKYMLNLDEKVILSPKKSLHLLSKLIKKYSVNGEEKITNDYEKFLQKKKQIKENNSNSPIFENKSFKIQNCNEMTEELQKQSQILENEEKSNYLILKEKKKKKRRKRRKKKLKEVSDEELMKFENLSLKNLKKIQKKLSIILIKKKKEEEFLVFLILFCLFQTHNLAKTQEKTQLKIKN